MSPNARGWCLLLSILVMLGMLAYPIWFTAYPAWGALGFILANSLGFAGFWPIAPAGERGTYAVLSGLVIVIIAGSAFAGWFVGYRNGSAWLTYGVNLGVWLGIFALLNPGKPEGGNVEDTGRN